MREFKFRAWRDDIKEMNSKVLVGNTCYPDSEDYTAHCIHNGDQWVNFDECDDITLMQFTGLIDKKKTDIYEGDCLATNDDEVIGFIEFDNGAFRVNNNDDNHTNCNIVADTAARLRVIGNIYQNPELIENNN